MGEYAKYQGSEVKIGTCADMFYLRLEDAAKVEPLPGNIDPTREDGLRFRLPYPDEGGQSPGVGDYLRGVRLYRVESDGTLRGKRTIDYAPAWLADTITGRLQLSHPSGLLVNVPCYHGVKLPDLGPDNTAHWNGKTHALELYEVKRTEGRVVPIVRCQHCGTLWADEWKNVLPFVQDEELRERLEAYQREGVA